MALMQWPDATFDLVQALVEKGVLTEEEAMPFIKAVP